jgi:hypothetical protein
MAGVSTNFKEGQHLEDQVS